MRIGIIVAMGKELQLLQHIISNKKECKCSGLQIYSGEIGNHEVYAMQCGIGKINAAIGTWLLTDNYAPDLIITTGVAGGADISVKQADIVVGEQIAYHDVWCGPGTIYGQASEMPLYFESSKEIIKIAKSLAEQFPIKFGLICSGDKFISTQEEIGEIKNKFPQAMAVDMESAAIAHVCHIKQIPIFAIRIISDTPGGDVDNTSQYENFWDAAPLHTFQVLCNILQQINEPIII